MNGKGIKKRIIELFRAKGINVNRASKMFGIPQRTLNRQVNEDGNVGMELVYALLDNYPELSVQWLLLGEGDMMFDNKCAVADYAVPYYSDLPVTAGLRDAVEQMGEQPNAYISIPSQNAEFFFPVSGTSMEPEIYTGDIVGVRRINSIADVKPEYICLIITNEARMIKRCYQDENNADLLWCVSPNYPTFSLNKSDITAIFRVVSRIQYF